MNKIIQENIHKIKKICEENYVEQLFLFGSATNNSFDYEKSDIDLLVILKQMEPIKRGETLLKIWDEFKQLFCRKVDLITGNNIKNKTLQQAIDKTKIIIYGSES